MKNKKTIFTTILIILFFVTLKSQVYFNNKYNEPVHFAIGYYVDTKDYKGWYSTGCYKIEPGEKKDILGDKI